eukprot:1159720-Pelagomonas_calceolata.AAC.4
MTLLGEQPPPPEYVVRRLLPWLSPPSIEPEPNLTLLSLFSTPSIEGTAGMFREGLRDPAGGWER